MYKTAVMGDYGSIYGFAALGIDTFPVTETAEVLKTFKTLADGDYAVIFITEEAAERIKEKIAEYSAKTTPAVILIPGAFGNTGKGVENVKKSVEQAVGSDILFGSDD